MMQKQFTYKSIERLAGCNKQSEISFASYNGYDKIDFGRQKMI